jgi:hypothetical protein
MEVLEERTDGGADLGQARCWCIVVRMNLMNRIRLERTLTAVYSGFHLVHVEYACQFSISLRSFGAFFEAHNNT